MGRPVIATPLGIALLMHNRGDWLARRSPLLPRLELGGYGMSTPYTLTLRLRADIAPARISQERDTAIMARAFGGTGPSDADFLDPLRYSITSLCIRAERRRSPGTHDARSLPNR